MIKISKTYQNHLVNRHLEPLMCSLKKINGNLDTSKDCRTPGKTPGKSAPTPGKTPGWAKLTGVKPPVITGVVRNYPRLYRGGGGNTTMQRPVKTACKREGTPCGKLGKTPGKPPGKRGG